MRQLFVLIPVMSALSGGIVFGAAQDNVHTAAATASLLDQYPGLRVHQVGSSVQAIYGAPMTAADTPERAAQWWLDDHSAALGVENLDLRLVRSNAVGQAERFTVFVYAQFIGSVPVELGLGRLLVLNGVPNQVVYVGGRFAQAPIDGYAADSISGASALASVQAMGDYAHPTEWTEPELVVFYGDGLGETVPSVRAWKFQGTHPILSEFESYSFFVNAADGVLVHVRNEVYNVDVEGHVDGNATSGLFPDTASNPPIEMVMEGVRVSIVGGNDAHSDDTGDFVIANAGAGNVTVSAQATNGVWVTVLPEQGSPITDSENVTPPGPANLLLNGSPTEFNTAQTNAHIQVTAVHDFYKDRQPGFNGLDIAIPTTVNINSTCNAFYSGSTINFYKSEGNGPNDCPNTAYTTVVAHEYGHFLVAVKGLGQGSFGEGLGDTLASMLYNTPGTGHDFFGPDHGPLRTAEDVEPFPCSGEIHACGVTLAGVWWEIKLAMDEVMGEENGLAYTQQLFTDWMEITSGGSGNNSAHPGTAIEVLTVDDDDGNIGNGTPNFLDICDAFASRNITCPQLAILSFSYPNGLPADLVVPNAEMTVRVNVVGIEGTPEPGTGTVSYSIDGDPFTTVAMAELAPNEYEATLPALECVQNIDFYFSADDSEGTTWSDPSNAPASSFSSLSAAGASTITILAHDFEADPGWTVSGTALAGHWDRGVPVNNARGDPATDFDGSGQCFVTANTTQEGEEDIDGGSTILTSVVYDLSDLTRPQVSYARWYHNTFGADPGNDTFVIEVSERV